MTQAAFSFAPQPPAQKAWRRVRETSVAVYAHLRDSGTLAKRQDDVLRAVAAIKNRTGGWPTACEVLDRLANEGAIPDRNPNHVKPRLTELASQQVLVRGPKRKSQISGIACLTWQVRAR